MEEKEKTEAIKPSMVTAFEKAFKDDFFKNLKNKLTLELENITPETYEDAMAKVDVPEITTANIKEPLDDILIKFALACETCLYRNLDVILQEITPPILQKAKDLGCTDLCKKALSDDAFCDELSDVAYSITEKHLNTAGVSTAIGMKGLNIFKRIFAARMYDNLVETCNNEPEKPWTDAIDDAAAKAVEQALETLSTDIETTEGNLSSIFIVYWTYLLPVIIGAIHVILKQRKTADIFNNEYKAVISAFICRK